MHSSHCANTCYSVLNEKKTKWFVSLSHKYERWRFIGRTISFFWWINSHKTIHVPDPNGAINFAMRGVSCSPLYIVLTFCTLSMMAFCHLIQLPSLFFCHPNSMRHTIARAKKIFLRSLCVFSLLDLFSSYFCALSLSNKHATITIKSI